MWLNARRSALLSLLVVSASACDEKSPVIPTSPQAPTAPAPAPSPRVAVRLEGHVLDEFERPVHGATVTLTSIGQGSGYETVPSPGPSTAADETGRFSLTLYLPQNWRDVMLGVERQGYDSTQIYVDPAGANRLVLRLYKTLTIGPGESIQTALLFGHYVCGWESWPCRRIFVKPLSDGSVALEVIPMDGQNEIGLVVGVPDGVPTFDLRRLVTVSVGDEVWIVGGFGRVTIRAAAR